MTTRSTRNKIRWQAEMAMKEIERAQTHLKTIHDMAQGQSDYINNQLANVTALSEMLYKVIEAFREGL